MKKLVLLIVILILGACTGADKKNGILEEQEIRTKKKPKWVMNLNNYKLKYTNTVELFLARSSENLSEEEARKNAIKDGERQLMEYLGGLENNPYIESMVLKNIADFKIRDEYSEKYKSFSGEILYDKYILFEINKFKLIEIKEKIANAKNKVKVMLLKADEFIKEKKYTSALKKFKEIRQEYKNSRNTYDFEAMNVRIKDLEEKIKVYREQVTELLYKGTSSAYKQAIKLYTYLGEEVEIEKIKSKLANYIEELDGLIDEYIREKKYKKVFEMLKEKMKYNSVLGISNEDIKGYIKKIRNEEKKYVSFIDKKIRKLKAKKIVKKIVKKEVMTRNSDKINFIIENNYIEEDIKEALKEIFNKENLVILTKKKNTIVEENLKKSLKKEFKVILSSERDIEKLAFKYLNSKIAFLDYDLYTEKTFNGKKYKAYFEMKLEIRDYLEEKVDYFNIKKTRSKYTSYSNSSEAKKSAVEEAFE